MYKIIGEAANRTFRVVWMLEELGQEYERIAARPHADAIYAHSPLGKLPVLLAGDEALTDSVAILTYLADKHGALTARAGTIDRARQDGLTMQILDELETPLWTAARHSFVLPLDKRVPQIKDTLRYDFANHLKRLAQRFVGPFLMGDEMRVPDILATHCLDWALAAKFEVQDETLRDYAGRMRDRDGYRRAVASERSLGKAPA